MNFLKKLKRNIFLIYFWRVNYMKSNKQVNLGFGITKSYLCFPRKNWKPQGRLRVVFGFLLSSLGFDVFWEREMRRGGRKGALLWAFSRVVFCISFCSLFFCLVMECVVWGECGWERRKGTGEGALFFFFRRKLGPSFLSLVYL